MAFAVRHAATARSRGDNSATRAGALTRTGDDAASVKSVSVSIAFARSADDSIAGAFTIRYSLS